MRNINPANFISMLTRNINPQNMLMNMVKQNSNIPMFNNLQQMINNNDVNGVEQMARNLANERGVDIDDLKNNLLSQLRI